MMNWEAVLVGYGVSLIGGLVAVAIILWALRQLLPDEAAGGESWIPGWMVGLVERIFFTTAVGLNLSGTVVAMMLWLAAKMAANWGARPATAPAVHGVRVSALLGGVVSMLFALVGGVLAQGIG